MLLRELYEAPGKTAAMAFGRLNPPTIGHAKLVAAIEAQEGDHYLFLSQTQKPKTDPLDFATKMKLAKQFFPGINVGHQAVRTPIQALEQLQGLGYTDVVFIAGSDRVDGFQKLFDTYNGQPDKTGKVPFKFNSIKVVSAGERDPDADGAEGMSASKMRAAAAAGDLESFAQGVPDKKLAKTMYDAVRNGMGVKDEQPVEEADVDGVTGQTVRAMARLKARYPHADSDLELMLAAITDNKNLIKATDFDNDEEADDLAARLDKIEKAVKNIKSKKESVKEADVVVDKSSLVPYIKNLIMDYLDKEQDVEKLSKLLKMMVGREIKTRGGKRYTITRKDIDVALQKNG